MDSLTQITLGAAVGEIVLGKKIGNRALLWGAVGGTIPDLDVLTSGFVSELDSLAYHRGFSHSIVFAVLGAFGFGWLIDRLYQSPWHKYVAWVSWLLIPIGVFYFFYRIFDVTSVSIPAVIIILGAMALLYRRYFINEWHAPDATLRDWQWLFFWTIFTHPLLDCFTTYGTQLFQPFSDYRVSFNAISVADPIYTLPFLICLIALSLLHRSKKLRRTLAWTGLGLSSAYMLFCVINKSGINKVMETSLEQQQIEYKRYMTSPTILNNILWYCLAETEDGYYYGLYSIFDKNKNIKLNYTPRQEDLISDQLPDDRTIRVLKWFSNGYYNFRKEGDELVMSDLRFGSMNEDPDNPRFIFNFLLDKGADGRYHLAAERAGPPDPEEREGMMKTLWTRIKGI